MSNECDSRRCWEGFKHGCCPRRRLENEKLLLGVMLAITIGLLVWSAT